MIGQVRRAVFKQVYRAAVSVRGEGSVFARIERLRELEREPRASVERQQRDALAGLLRAKLPHVPRLAEWAHLAAGMNSDNVLYRLSNLPILEKEDLQRQPRECLASDWKGRSSAKTTGGSTGRPVTVYKNPAAIAQEMAATWLGYGWFGLAPGDSCVRFWGQPERNLKRRLRYRLADGAMNRLTLSAFGYTDDDLERYLRTISRFRPRYLYGYVSALEDLARYVIRNRGRLDAPWLRCVVTTSEVLSQPQRRAIQEAFGVPVQNEYGCGEVGPIAYECVEGSLHLLPTNQYVEIIRADGSVAQEGEAGQIVVTDLTNQVMPLIRYCVGDNGALGAACTCGRPFPVLAEVFGREYDFVETPDGARYHGEFFMYLFEDLRGKHPEIGQFQVVQTGTSELLVRLQLNQPDSKVTDRVVAEVHARLPRFQVRVETVERLERRPSGKMRVVENRVTRPAETA